VTHGGVNLGVVPLDAGQAVGQIDEPAKHSRVGSRRHRHTGFSQSTREAVTIAAQRVGLGGDQVRRR